jgi:uncharacterized protein YbjT (DUF2867 family)
MTMLVLGASGRTGRRVLERLEERGVPARAGSRSADPPFDWEDRSTWARVLADVDAAYVSFYPDLAIPGAPEAVGALAELAVESGLRRLVLLAGRGEDEAQRAEQVVRGVVPACTVVRCSWFCQNFSESFFLEPLLAGELALPVEDVREPFIDADDIADVAVEALTGDGHAGQVYELTGPRLLSFAEALEEISKACGRELHYTTVSMEAFAAELADAGLLDGVVSFLRYLFGEVLDGRNSHLTDGVQRALGREPRDFSEFARRTATTGVWDA